MWEVAMPDTPTPWELQRQIDLIRAELRAEHERVRADLQSANDRGERHVTTDSLVLFLARLEDQIKAHDGDLVEERTMRKADIVAEQDARKSAVDTLSDRIDALTRNLRWVATAIVLPIGLFVADILLRRP